MFNLCTEHVILSVKDKIVGSIKKRSDPKMNMHCPVSSRLKKALKEKRNLDIGARFQQVATSVRHSYANNL